MSQRAVAAIGLLETIIACLVAALAVAGLANPAGVVTGYLDQTHLPTTEVADTAGRDVIITVAALATLVGFVLALCVALLVAATRVLIESTKLAAAHATAPRAGHRASSPPPGTSTLVSALPVMVLAAATLTAYLWWLRTEPAAVVRLLSRSVPGHLLHYLSQVFTDATSLVVMSPVVLATGPLWLVCRHLLGRRPAAGDGHDVPGSLRIDGELGAARSPSLRPLAGVGGVRGGRLIVADPGGRLIIVDRTNPSKDS